MRIVSNFVFAIKKRKSRVYGVIYWLLKRIINLNIPAIRLIYLPLYYVRVSLLFLSRYFLQKCINEPLLKVRCVEVGQGLRIEKGFPLIAEDLILRIGNRVTINGKNTFSCNSVMEQPELIIGDNTYIGYGVSISVGERVTIGKKCLIAEGVCICDNNGHPTAPNRRHLKVGIHEIKPVRICNNVWVGNGAFIGKGVIVGEGAIIGANSVVVKDIPAYSIFSGNPGTVVRVFRADEIEELAD